MASSRRCRVESRIIFEGVQYVAHICCIGSCGGLLDGVFSVFPTEFSNARDGGDSSGQFSDGLRVG